MLKQCWNLKNALFFVVPEIISWIKNMFWTYLKPALSDSFPDMRKQANTFILIWIKLNRTQFIILHILDGLRSSTVYGGLHLKRENIKMLPLWVHSADLDELNDMMMQEFVTSFVDKKELADGLKYFTLVLMGLGTHWWPGAKSANFLLYGWSQGCPTTFSFLESTSIVHESRASRKKYSLCQLKFNH